jgi:hypothetical protein
MPVDSGFEEKKVAVGGIDGSGEGRVAIPSYVFRPQSGAGLSGSIGAVTARLGPLTVGKYHHIIVDTLCWVRFGGDAVVATSTDFPMAPGTYQYLPTAGLNYIAFIQHSAGGTILIGRAEA